MSKLVNSTNRDIAKKIATDLTSLYAKVVRNMTIDQLNSTMELLITNNKLSATEYEEYCQYGYVHQNPDNPLKLYVAKDKTVKLAGGDKGEQREDKEPTKPTKPKADTSEVMAAKATLSQLGALGESILTVLDNVTVAADVDGDAIKAQIDSTVSTALDSIQKQVDKACSKLAPKGIEITVNGKAKHKDESYHHKQFDTVLASIQVRPVYLYGEASGGKTTVYKQLASALGSIYDYDCKLFTSVQLFSQHEIQGYNNATGEYVSTVFYDWFKNGGLMAVDELDRSIAKALTCLNQMLENKFFTFPNGEYVEMHKHAFFISSGNTPLNASGSSSRYNASEAVDSATVDRFIAIAFDYDEHIERIMCGDNVAWLETVRGIRASASELGIDLLVSTRPIRDGAQLLANGLDMINVIDITIMKGLADEQVIKLLRNANVINRDSQWTGR